MMRLTAALALALALATPAAAHSESAPLLSLIYLKKTQNKQGLWTGGQGPSALAALAFLGAGHTHRYGRFKKQVKEYLRHQLRRQHVDGHFGEDVPLAEHAMATLALNESYGMTKSPLLKEAAIRATRYLAKRCQTELGWGSLDPEGQPPSHGIVWAAAALRSAKVAELKVDGLAAALTRGQAVARKELADNPTRPAVLAAALHFAGGDIKGDARVTALARRLADNPAKHGKAMGPIEHWAASILMFARGDADWTAWNAHMRQRLVDTQVRKKPQDPLRGSWKPTREGDDELGREGLTGIQAMTLEIYYRYARVLK